MLTSTIFETLISVCLDAKNEELRRAHKTYVTSSLHIYVHTNVSYFARLAEYIGRPGRRSWCDVSERLADSMRFRQCEAAGVV